MTRLPTLNPTQFVRALKRAGFVEHTQRGSHLMLKHPVDGRRTVVPMHGGELKRSLMKLILKQIELDEAAFRDLL